MPKSNVNPGQYKTAGRERPGDDIVHEVQKQKYAQGKVETERQAKGDPSLPGASQAKPIITPEVGKSIKLSERRRAKKITTRSGRM